MDVNMKRNIALVGHAHCGKTSLTESLLFFTGATTRKGDVMQGNTLSDFHDDEIERHISINASFLRLNYKKHTIQLIDTPGYSDFIGETVSSLRATDGAVLVVDATQGVEVGTEFAWERLTELKIPRIIFINKIDKSEAKVDEALASIQDSLSKKALIIDLDDPQFIESVAETDDTLLEQYLEKGELSPEEVRGALKKAVLEAKIFPVITGAAAKDQGIEKLLDGIIEDLPSPLERSPFAGKDLGSMEPQDLQPTDKGPFAGFIFKSVFDPHLGNLSLMRVLSGTVSANSDCFNLTANSKEHISTINLLQGKEQNSISEATCGDIVALPKLKRSHVCDCFSDSKHKFALNPINFPEPSISASIKPKTRADEEKISTSLQKMTEEDHTLRVGRDEDSKEMLISGIGDLHLRVILDRMKRRYNVDVELGTPKVAYRETITKKGQARHKYKKQSGGRGQYGDVELIVEPIPRGGAEYEFVNEIFGGAIPKNYIPSVEKGVKQAISDGVLAKSPLVNIKVTLIDGSYHDVDSSDMAFQIAGALAFKDAVKTANLVLLEPIMEVAIVVPDDYIGQISGDISSRRGRILGAEAKGKNQVLRANAPLSELFKYASDLRSMTGGRGSYGMKFSHYEIAPAKVTDKVIQEKTVKE